MLLTEGRKQKKKQTQNAEKSFYGHLQDSVKELESKKRLFQKNGYTLATIFKVNM